MLCDSATEDGRSLSKMVVAASLLGYLAYEQGYKNTKCAPLAKSDHYELKINRSNSNTQENYMHGDGDSTAN